MLKQAVLNQEGAIAAALKADLNKSYFEAFETEIGIVLQEISYAEKHLRDWMKPQKVKTPLCSSPGSSKIYPEPYGVVLIMSPWNYPFQLALTPLVGAIAAGNCALVKPGSYAAETAKCINNIISKCFESQYVSVVLGGRDANADLLEQKFDYIFFTGGINVGKTVMSAAAKASHLYAWNLAEKALALWTKQPI
jgi:aldehyde dehydrogenase (NAD+)